MNTLDMGVRVRSRRPLCDRLKDTGLAHVCSAVVGIANGAKSFLITAADPLCAAPGVNSRPVMTHNAVFWSGQSR